MKVPSISKRCERCDEFFEIPNVRASHARELLLQFHRCPCCLFAPGSPEADKSGRCRDCSLSFALVDHHAKGLCKRDYMRRLRHEPGAA